MRVLNVGTLNARSKYFAPWKIWELDVPFQLYGTAAGAELMVRICLYLFLCGYFLIWPIHRSHTASFSISFRGNPSMFTWTFSVCGKRIQELPISPSWSTSYLLLFLWFFYFQCSYEIQGVFIMEQALSLLGFMNSFILWLIRTLYFRTAIFYISVFWRQTTKRNKKLFFKTIICLKSKHLL